MIALIHERRWPGTPSPEDERPLHEQPQMMQELMPRVMAKAQEKAETVLKEMDYNRRVQQIMDKGRAQTSTNPK